MTTATPQPNPCKPDGGDAATPPPFVPFSSTSAMPLRFLSNFSDAEFTMTWPSPPSAMPGIPEHMRGRTATYDTSEHAFQALRSLDLESARAFEKGGLFSGYRAFARWPAKIGSKGGLPYVATIEDLREKKERYWGKRGCSGITPKMAVNLPPSVLKAHWGVSIAPAHHHGRTFADQLLVWRPILMAKFEQNPRHRAALLPRPSSPLLFVERGRFRDPAQYWSAYYQHQSGEGMPPIIIGGNMMGRLITETRRLIIMMTPSEK